MEESKDFIWAQYNSGWREYASDYYRHVGPKRFNLQLRYWVEALEKFQNLYPGNYKVEELLIILNHLYGSLETLAGVNITPPKKNYTPSLNKMYKVVLKNDRGWDLQNEKPDLFALLMEMDRYHKNLCKHINISPSRKDLLKQIDYERIRDYIKATRDIWLWILDKKYEGNIPKDELKLFNL